MTSKELLLALEYLRRELGLFSLKWDMFEHEFNQEVAETIKKAKRTKRKPGVELASWTAWHEYNQELRADLIEAARLGTKHGMDLPAIRNLAVALEGGFDMPKSIQFVFDAKVEIERLIEAVQSPIDDPWVFVRVKDCTLHRQTVWNHSCDESRDYIRKTDKDGIYQIRQNQLYQHQQIQKLHSKHLQKLQKL